MKKGLNLKQKKENSGASFGLKISTEIVAALSSRCWYWSPCG